MYFAPKTRLTQPLLMRWVLVLFALAVAAATASPLIKPISLEMLCSTSGASKLLLITPDGEEAQDSHGLDCALCLPQLGTPVPQAHQPKLASALALQPLPTARSAHMIALTQPPLPSRGPPAIQT